jgi:hypothetical protein
MKKKGMSLRLTSGNSKQTNKAYVDLCEQVQLLRKSIILIHEQLARIESKLDDQVAKVNASILLK